ncbi:histone-lysine N-methyltransferase ATX4-like [Iris pallida]|uniref:Histone-lysine N-methyltransferase ATX4-like n=1 Tax=Iris pallida TaxID=29817 RepID=A0AAX6HIY5_IRIPA|nr:histone-lysine N-methyltransferase ATX4-like [Iris pallida]
MIVRRSLRTAMPRLKRCKAVSASDSDSSSDSDEDGHGRGAPTPKKRCTPDGDDVSSTEAESGVRRRMTSRGRARFVPARFRDAVLIDPTKREKRGPEDLDPDFDPNPKPRTRPRSVTLYEREDLYWECQNFDARRNSTSRSSVTYVHEESSLSKKEGEQEEEEKGKISVATDQFATGEVVWAQVAGKYLVWPAMVMNPARHATDYVSGAVRVMFFGHSASGIQRDYGWVQQEMIFPFIDYMDRFQGQTELHESKPSDFRVAIEEAFLAEYGFVGKQDDVNISGQSAYQHQLFPGGIQEATGSNHDQECQSQIKAVNRSGLYCGSCGLSLPAESLKQLKCGSEQLVCRHCANLLRSRQYCGICKKIWHHGDTVNLVCCDGCQICVHAECIKMYSNVKDLGNSEYYCPECEPNYAFSDAETKQTQVRSNNKSQKDGCLDTVDVLCNGMEAKYLPDQHMVICKCSPCKGKKLSLGEWERHTGCRSKKWKSSVKVKSTMIPLSRWLEDNHVNVTSSSNAKHVPQKDRRDKLLAVLKGAYDPIYAKWTTERCAVCRWVEDWEDNKIIICNRCQVAVHQECYGARGKQDFTSWVCRACERPHEQRDCCLCPVKGGALKPTDVDTLWVHVTCAWFQPIVFFASAETMEPAVGILHIPSEYFGKACVICKQRHGACTKCYTCSTYYHAMCASRAGFGMELRCSEKNGRQIIECISYCGHHRTPNPDNVLIMNTPQGVFTSKKLLQQKGKPNASRQIRMLQSKFVHAPHDSCLPTYHSETPSSARCLIYKMNETKRKREDAIAHLLMGHCRHSLDAIESVNSHRDEKDTRSFSTFRERLRHLQATIFP